MVAYFAWLDDYYYCLALLNGYGVYTRLVLYAWTQTSADNDQISFARHLARGSMDPVTFLSASFVVSWIQALLVHGRGNMVDAAACNKMKFL